VLTIQDIKNITKGRWVQKGDSPAVNGVSIDTRTIKKGNVYIAIKGQRFNGHQFISAAQ